MEMWGARTEKEILTTFSLEEPLSVSGCKSGMQKRPLPTPEDRQDSVSFSNLKPG